MAWVARALRSREQIITWNICCDAYTADFVFYFQQKKLHDFCNHVFFKIILHNCTGSLILVKHMKLGLKSWLLEFGKWALTNLMEIHIYDNNAWNSFSFPGFHFQVVKSKNFCNFSRHMKYNCCPERRRITVRLRYVEDWWLENLFNKMTHFWY